MRSLRNLPLMELSLLPSASCTNRKRKVSELASVTDLKVGTANFFHNLARAYASAVTLVWYQVIPSLLWLTADGLQPLARSFLTHSTQKRKVSEFVLKWRDSCRPGRKKKICHRFEITERVGAL